MTKTKQLAIMSLSIALAFVTSYIKLFKMPMGGSITLFSMFFIAFIGYKFGTYKGVLCGMAYGLLQFIIEPYFLSIPQVICDYLLAFAGLGMSGVLRNKKYGLYSGYLLGVGFRLMFSVISGALFFASYADGTGLSPLVYSILYNGTYIIPEAILTIIVLLIPSVRKVITKKYN